MKKSIILFLFLAINQFGISQNINELPKLESFLSGSWSSEAWGGVLNESWEIGKDGHLIQSAQYIENGQVLYESNSKIENVRGTMILFSVIKDNNPKIFKATSWSKTHITFENDDYRNPSMVKYEFVSKDNFKRTISGMEKEVPTSFTFNFRRMK